MTVKKGLVKAKCQFGAATAPPLVVGATLGKDPGRAARTLEKQLQRARLNPQMPVGLIWVTRVFSAWPADSVTWRSYPHPGVYGELLLAQNGDSVSALGGAHAVCASPPGAPDSVTLVAQQLVVHQLEVVLQATKADLD